MLCSGVGCYAVVNDAVQWCRISMQWGRILCVVTDAVQ